MVFQEGAERTEERRGTRSSTDNYARVTDLATPWAGTFESGSKVLLFLGRLHAKKGLDPLLKAWSKNRREAESSGWRLALVGWDDGGYAAMCQGWIEDYGIANTCRWFGPAAGEAKAAALACCEAFILPSYSEGLPMAVLEAWSYRKPVFMTDACNLPEGFATGAARRITTDEAELADELRSVMTSAISAAELQLMGEKGYALARDRFSWKTVADQFIELYTWVAGGGKPEFVSCA